MFLPLSGMGVTFFLARKLSLSSSGHRSTPAVKVAVIAVALSVVVMMGAIAIVLGFKNEITKKISGFNSHISLIPYISTRQSDEEYAMDSDESIITLTPTLKEMILSTPGVKDVAVQVSIPTILKTSDDFKGVYMKSLAGESLLEFIDDSLIEGEIPDFTRDESINKIILSKSVADKLSLKRGSKIDTYFISDQLRVRKLEVAGIFDSHFDSYDDTFIYGSLQLIQSLAQLSKSQGTSLSVSVDNLDDVEKVADDLTDNLIKAYTQGKLFKLYQCETVRQSGAAYYNWLAMLDMNVIVVIILMIIVSCVTLCSGMLILMVDKLRFIALMQTLGATRKLIGNIFLLLATKIALIGLLAGDIIGLIVLLIQKHTHFLPLDPDSYYIDFVPVEISWFWILLLNIGVLVVIFSVLWIPSRFGIKKAPANILSAE